MSQSVVARLLFVPLICLAALSVAQVSQKTEASKKAEAPLNVIVQPVALQNLQNNIEALGTLRAAESAIITAKTTKTVTNLYFTDGQRVHKGMVLVEMTNAEESALMDEARLTAKEAKKQLDRASSLAKTGALSPSLLDQRTREYEAAQARYLAVQARFNDLIITAPFNGVVGLRDISLGSLVAPGQIITTLNDDSKMKLDFTVPAIYLRNVRIGLPITAQSHDLGNKIFKGKIASIDNHIDESTRAIKVRAILDNANQELKQGLLMSVVVSADVRQSLVLSEAALVPMGSNNFVFVLMPAKNTAVSPWVAEKRQIQIGQRYKGFVEVLSGLKEGEKVVTHGLQKIHAGQALNIMAEQSNDPAKNPQSLAELLQQQKVEGK